jgi:hypothetical protein
MVTLLDSLSQSGARERRGLDPSPIAPARGESKHLQKMENRGNEAKKWLKTHDITFFDVADYARFACNFAPIGRLNEQKQQDLRKTYE